MAKGVEDTAFYRYNRFLALNEVGGAPDRFGAAPALFHKANAQRAEHWPHAMLATATHDTKRGEDARSAARRAFGAAGRMAAPGHALEPAVARAAGDVEGRAPPDRDDEYMFYQMLVGSWPIDMLDAEPGALEAYRARHRGGAGEVAARGEAPLELDGAERRVRAGDAGFRAGGAEPGRNGFLTSFLPFVQARRPARRREQPGADHPEAHGAGRSGHLSGLRIVGLQSGRPRQSPAGRLRARKTALAEFGGGFSRARAAGAVRNAASTLARRADQARADGARCFRFGASTRSFSRTGTTSR